MYTTSYTEKFFSGEFMTYAESARTVGSYLDEDDVGTSYEVLVEKAKQIAVTAVFTGNNLVKCLSPDGNTSGGLRATLVRFINLSRKGKCIIMLDGVVIYRPKHIEDYSQEELTFYIRSMEVIDKVKSKPLLIRHCVELKEAYTDTKEVQEHHLVH